MAICTAAASLFASHGYEATSLQDLASAVGLTKAGLYHYFPSKQALLEAIVVDTLKELIEGAHAATDGEGGYHEKIERFMVAHAEYFSENGDKYRASFFGRSGGELGNYTSQELQLRKEYVASLEKVLHEAVQAGEMKISDVPTFARGILGMLNWMARWYKSSGPLSATDIAKSYAQALLFGVAV